MNASAVRVAFHLGFGFFCKAQRMAPMGKKLLIRYFDLTSFAQEM